MSSLLERFNALEPIPRAGVIVALVLVVATLASLVLRNLAARSRVPPKLAGEVWQRTRSWWVMAAVFFAGITISPWAALVLFAFMSFWALKEYVTLLHTRPADHRAILWSFLAVPMQYVWIAIGWDAMFLVFIPVWMFLWLPIRLVLAKETSGFLAAMSQIQWGLMAFVFGLSHLAWMSRWGGETWAGYDGRALVLFLVFTVEMSDVLQFCFGKAFGKHKIMPTVSPNKTWEGFVLGVLAASALSLVLRGLTPFTVWECMGAALVANVAGFCGGAVMSAVKRDFGTKDFGSLLPGHGGMIDRVDSLCYAAPAFVHLVRWLHE